MISLYHQYTPLNLLIWMMTLIYCVYFSYNYHKLLIIYYVLQSVLRSLQICYLQILHVLLGTSVTLHVVKSKLEIYLKPLILNGSRSQTQG